MNRFRIIFVALFVIWLLCPSDSFAQSAIDTVGSLPGVEITSTVDHTDSYVGDFINYELTITYDSTYQLTPPPLGANLGMFEVKDYEPDVQTRLDDGRIQSTTKFVISTYTTGDYVIPPLPVVFTLPDSTRKVMISEALPITVHSLLGDATDSTGGQAGVGPESLRKPKPPFSFERDYTMYYIYGGIGLLVILAGLYFWYWRRKHCRPGEYVDTRDPWEIAFEKMAVLKERRYIEDGAFKLYYVDLTELAREFLGRVYAHDALEMTTDEFRLAFKEVLKPESRFDQVIEFMRHADLVKFAKFLPERERAESDYLFMHELISDIRDEAIRRAEEERLAREAAAKAGKSQTPEEQNA